MYFPPPNNPPMQMEKCWEKIKPLLKPETVAALTRKVQIMNVPEPGTTSPVKYVGSTGSDRSALLVEHAAHLDQLAAEHEILATMGFVENGGEPMVGICLECNLVSLSGPKYIMMTYVVSPTLKPIEPVRSP